MTQWRVKHEFETGGQKYSRVVKVARSRRDAEQFADEKNTDPHRVGIFTVVPPSKGKVFGGTHLIHGLEDGGSHHQFRVLIKAKTQKRALEIAAEAGLHLMASDMRDWNLTGNLKELEATAGSDEGIWYRPLDNFDGSGIQPLVLPKRGELEERWREKS